jgi:hypothetical protein
MLMFSGVQASDTADGNSKFMAYHLNQAGAFRTSKDFELQAMANKEEDKDVQKMLTKASDMPIGLPAIGVALLSLAAMLGVRMRRGMQSGDSSGHGIDMSIPMASRTAEPAVFLVSPQKPSPKQTVRPFGGFGKKSSPAPAPASDTSDLGVLAPLGFFDPLGLAAKGTAEDFERRRITELKHGRVAMAAFVGYLVPELYKWPGYLSKELDLKFEDVPNGLNALPVVPGLGWFQMIMVVGWLEAGPFKETRSEYAGDFGWPYFGKQLQNPEEKKRKLNMELQNGRAAMFGIMGLLTQDAVNGEVTIFPGTDIA